MVVELVDTQCSERCEPYARESSTLSHGTLAEVAELVDAQP